jgi:hypothetical protein
MDTLQSYGVLQSGVDMLGYYGGNWVVSNYAGVSQKPHIEDTVLFGISDLIIRNGVMTFMSEKSMFAGNIGRNAYIGVVSFILTSGLDLLRGNEIGDTVKKNLIKNAVGIATNSAIDMVVPNYLN